MSGYMVTTEAANGNRNFYMVNADDPDRARDAVNQMMGMSTAQALAPIPDATIAQHNLRPGQAWLCTTTGPTGEVTHSELK
ncbi:MAG TPA: hypothetical protein VF650_01720 [Allosphingosinicella sp.]